MSARLWKTAVISGIISVLAAVLLLALFAVMLLKGEQPDRGAAVWSSSALIFGAMTAGCLGAVMHTERPLLGSLLSGVVYTAVLSAVTLPFSGGFSALGFFIKTVAAIASSAAMGAVMAKRGTTRYKNPRKAAKHAGKIYKGRR